MGEFNGQALVLVPNVGTYVELCYIEDFSVNKYKHFEGMGHTFWVIMLLYSALKGLPSVPCEQGSLF